MKLYSTILAIATVSLFAACGPKEGSPSSRNKIDHVMANESMYIDETLYFQQGSHVAEQWHWDGNTLYRIDYIDGGPYSENFFYDNRHRLARTTVPAYSLRNEFHYDGRQLDFIECFRSDTLLYTLHFFHDGKTLTEIEWRSASGAKGSLIDGTVSCIKSRALDMVLGGGLASLMAGPTKINVPVGTRHYHMEWNDGNVTRIVVTGESEDYTIDLSYDDKRNIYRHLFGYSELNDPVYGFEMLSKNNIVSIIMPYRDDDKQLFSYSYTYDGKYPSGRTLSYSFKVIDETDWTEAVCRKKRTEKYVKVGGIEK